ncbi:MAG: hypothetical protein CM1200mP26_17710 [Acidimicrobiales bacterium]|nr:MAG: hypothetical protein CM1200mP26_17710 [Acidimicrobiales bacterium]
MPILPLPCVTDNDFGLDRPLNLSVVSAHILTMGLKHFIMVT